MFVPFDLLAEVLPMEGRGAYLSYTQFFWTLGSIGMVLMAWVTLEPLGWRWLAALAAIPPVISLASLPFIPESPRWLITRQPPRTEEALEALRCIAKANGRHLPDDLELIHESHEVKDEGCNNLAELFLPEIRRTTLTLWVVWFAFGVVYYGIVLLNGREFETNEAVCSFEYAPMLVVSLSEVLGVVALVLIIDRLGRRLTQATTYWLCGILIIPVGLFRTVAPKTTFLFLARAMVMIGSAATWVATPELYPTEIRGTGHSVAGLISKFGALLVPFLVNSSLPDMPVMLGIAACTVMAGLAALALPETKSMRLGHDLKPSAAEGMDKPHPLPSLMEYNNTTTELTCKSLSSVHGLTPSAVRDRVLAHPLSAEEVTYSMWALSPTLTRELSTISDVINYRPP
ncbi:unnamed protein product, partial [Chrysoparadoxa australica]